MQLDQPFVVRNQYLGVGCVDVLTAVERKKKVLYLFKQAHIFLIELRAR